ncbi:MULTISPECIES: dihydrofolate reductase family protein [unclassified Microbacterium]|uniref:dihydrofolate reductase family protein n=1 Tax=unclassified Microbacterium TaxID=2609290 RepID=UPI000EAA4B99|nr:MULTISPECIES: dihydrofolate reductase family protein [unclassified Microbacterium]MBT2483739.1 dihydrofolate reductase family protein [Microbacterium sp. ISL-108]RKN66731.1 riboflavin biosynthesis protein RibD [Microbacterium sp. CGR2]
MSTNERRVVANIALSLDGFYQGPGDPADMSWLMPYALSDVSRDHLTGLWQNATTALLGRTNAEGFFAYWPTVADDENADSRDRAYGAWMRDAEKVVLSRSLESAPWSNARVFDEPAADVVARLKGEPGSDIVVFASVSVIRALLAADVVDRLSLTVFPQILGGGARLFDGEIPPSAWTLASAESGDGVVALTYDRVR